VHLDTPAARKTGCERIGVRKAVFDELRDAGDEDLLTYLKGRALYAATGDAADGPAVRGHCHRCADGPWGASVNAHDNGDGKWQPRRKLVKQRLCEFKHSR
jgi:hypothetical protein